VYQLICTEDKKNAGFRRYVVIADSINPTNKPNKYYDKSESSVMRDNTWIYVDGAWVKPLDGRVADIINPATERPVGQITLCTGADVDRAVLAARKAFVSFSKTSPLERLELLTSIARTYENRQNDLVDALIEELGVPRRLAKEFQVPLALWHLEVAISSLHKYKWDYAQSSRTIVRREPIGVVGAITPWNLPINQTVCKVFPSFATGCTVVHKPSELTPFTAHILAEIFHDAGVPGGVYNLVDGDGPTIGAAISSHPGIDMVSFTGSTAAGIDVAKRAADTVKRVHQELGGKCPNIILDDADLTKAITENIYRLMMNSGQVCHAPTRMLIPLSKMEETKNIAKQVVASVTLGDPQTDVYMGPVVSERQWNRVQSLIQKGIEEGATLLAGGLGRPEGLDIGYYVKPTIFADVTNDMTIAREEIFGPVLCIIGYKDINDAVAIANDTMYGLAAFIQSTSEERATDLANRIEAGMIYINGTSEDYESPWGGYKRSGNGREWGEVAFGEFTEMKAVIHKQA
jgi:aldehyde dehydrogenase (NAD+)